MQILNLPGPKKPKRGDRWFADCLQFTSGSQKLFLRLAVENGLAVGQLDMATGQWESLSEFGRYHFGEVPLKPWTQDFSRLVSYIGDNHTQYNTMICVDDAQHVLKWDSPQWVLRSIELNSGASTVCGIVFSPDGQWLYGAEIFHTGRTPQITSTSIARADVAALFAKSVIEASTTNPLLEYPLPVRSVPPTIWKQFVTLSQDVVVRVIAVSPDGRIVAAGTHTGETHLLRVRGGQTLGILKRKRRKRTDDVSVRRLAFSPSGKQLGVVVDGILRVWNVKSAELRWDAEDAKAHVIDLAYHPDGNTIAVVRSDGAAVLFDSESGTVRKRYDWKVGQLNSVAFSPDGLTCAAGGEKGQIVVWDVDS